MELGFEIDVNIKIEISLKFFIHFPLKCNALK